MATFTFQKPDKVIMIDSTDFEGKFEFRPLEPGYGLTIGNALRRVLLSSLEGFAFTSIKIDNVDHEFTSLPGIVEDVTEIILNLKQIRLKQQIDSVDNETVSVSVNMQNQLKAGLKKGDVIIEINGSAIEDIYGYMAILEKLNPGESSDVKLLRDNKEIIITIIH